MDWIQLRELPRLWDLSNAGDPAENGSRSWEHLILGGWT